MTTRVCNNDGCSRDTSRVNDPSVYAYCIGCADFLIRKGRLPEIERNAGDPAAQRSGSVQFVVDTGSLRDAAQAAIKIGCIRMHWGARNTCDTYTDGRALCAICALRAALDAPALTVERLAEAL